MSRGAHLNDVRWSFRQQVVAARSNETGYQRERDDFYPTPPEATEALLSVEAFTGPVWEPACGDGAISRVFEAGGHTVISSDLVDRGFGETRIDFLLEQHLRACNIVTNPPFKLAVPFVRHSLRLGAVKVAMLLKIAFLEGVERGELFRQSPLARVHVFSKRVTFRNTMRGEVNGSGMMAFAWFVWDRAHQGPPQLGWLPRATDGADELRAPPPNTESSPEYDEAADALESYNVGMKAIGERVAAGEPVPAFLLPERDRLTTDGAAGTPSSASNTDAPQGQNTEAFP